MEQRVNIAFRSSEYTPTDFQSNGRNAERHPSDIYIPREHPKRSSRPFAILFGSFILFFLSVGISITTLIMREETVAAPLVMIEGNQSMPPLELTYGPQPRLAELDFFKKAVSAFQEQRQSFIEADLSAMVVRYYEEGNVVFESPILSKGKEGSWWETPAGLYAVQSKAKNHLSSFGGVYQPWSMAFQGNFFIHGWPYYPGGTPVSSQYSGGCIRLSDTDAESLFALSHVGTPILVYEAQDGFDDFVYDLPLPDIDALSYLVADIENGMIIAESNATASLPIASITKLMTALVAAEHINLDNEVTITDAMRATTSVPRLETDTSMTAYSLFLPLLLESSNEAAAVLASLIGESRIVQLMNKKAEALGLEGTVFADASGAHSGNISTAHDLLSFITYLYRNRSFILKISSGKTVNTAYAVYPFGDLLNFNETPGLSGLVGGKVGKTTAAQETALVLYRMMINGNERTIAFIVLGTPDRFEAIRGLHKYIEERYDAHAP